MLGRTSRWEGGQDRVKVSEQEAQGWDASSVSGRAEGRPTRACNSQLENSLLNFCPSMQGDHHSYPKSAISGLKTGVGLQIRATSGGFWWPHSHTVAGCWAEWADPRLTCTASLSLPHSPPRTPPRGRQARAPTRRCLAPFSFLPHFPGDPRAK